MFLVSAEGRTWSKPRGWFRKPLQRKTRSVDCAANVLQKLLACGYRDVYITPVGQDGTSETVPEIATSKMSRDKRLTTRIVPLMVKQEVINVRIGAKLLEYVSHYSGEMAMSQNAFILEAIRFSLDSGHDKLDTSDIGLSGSDTSQYSIRMDSSMLAAIKKAAQKNNNSDSAWIRYALLTYLGRLSADDFS